MKKNNTEKFLFGIFAVVGSILVVVGICVLLVGFKKPENVVTITGEIVDIVRERDHDGDVHYDVYVDYEFDGKEYKEVHLSTYSSSMYEGKEIELFIDPEKPSRPKVPGADLIAGIICAVMGAIFGCIGIIPLVTMGRKSSKTQKLIEQGHYIMGKVERIDLNYNYSVNNRHPYVVYCNYQDDYTGTIYRFKSGNVWSDPGAYYQEGSDIRIYVDGQDYSNYFIDIEGSKQGNQKIVDYT